MGNIKTTVFSGLSILMAIMIHELSHGYTAYLFGDNTAKDDGRLSLNPLKHLDPMGTLSLIFFNFGWAKPVPVNFTRLKPQKLGSIAVSLAGCLANFITAIIAAVLLALQIKFATNLELLSLFLTYLIMYSIAFGVFNLVPIPPLDGSKVILAFLPMRIRYYVSKYERYFFILLMLLVVTGSLARITSPIINFIYNIIIKIIYGVIK